MIKIVERVAAITATLHDGTQMIVLTAGKKVNVAESSIPFLDGKDALCPEGTEPFAASNDLANKPLATLLQIAADEGIIPDHAEMQSSLAEAIAAKRAGADIGADAGASDDDLSQLDHDHDGNPGGSEPHEPPALAGKNKAELLAIAEAEGVEIAEGATNREITEAIESARLAADADDTSLDAPVA